MEIKLPYGIRNNSVVHISQISDSERGLMCACVCPSCGSPLQAKKGEVRQEHFSHSANCVTATETALHRLAKEIFAANNSVLLPDIIIKNSVFRCGEYFNYISCEMECRRGNVIPDIILSDGKNELMVEIIVTHGIDEIKYSKFKSENMSVMAINLSEVYYMHLPKADYSFLENTLIHKKELKSWVNNRLQNKALERLNRIIEKDRMINLNKKVHLEKQIEKNIQRIIRECAKYPNGLYPVDLNIEINHYWKKAYFYFKVKPEDLPEYLNYPIEGEFIIDCDRRIWQTTLFSMYVLNSNNKYFRVEWVHKWISHKKGLPLNPIAKTAYKYEGRLTNCKISSLGDVIGRFFLYLSNIGFVEPGPRYHSYNIPYQWDFIVK